MTDTLQAAYLALGYCGAQSPESGAHCQRHAHPDSPVHTHAGHSEAEHVVWRDGDTLELKPGARVSIDADGGGTGILTAVTATQATVDLDASAAWQLASQAVTAHLDLVRRI